VLWGNQVIVVIDYDFYRILAKKMEDTRWLQPTAKDSTTNEKLNRQERYPLPSALADG